MRCYTLHPKYAKYKESPVVPIISNGVIIWAAIITPIIANYCTLLGSFPPLNTSAYYVQTWAYYGNVSLSKRNA